MVSPTDPHGRNLGILDQNRYLFFQVAPQLYLSKNLVVLGIEPGTVDLQAGTLIQVQQ
jgi:hypothetical protein